MSMRGRTKLVILIGAFITVLLLACVSVRVHTRDVPEFTILFACENRTPVSLNVTGDAALYAPSLLMSRCSVHGGSNGIVRIQCPGEKLEVSPLVIEGQRLLGTHSDN